ncbi:recombinase family protein [Sphingomonas sp. XXL09]|uniref:recombinase family protein n=1 Tax=Sphingomonas sp. XXL09 TaxID=3457787 RepID=UPI00406BD1D0
MSSWWRRSIESAATRRTSPRYRSGWDSPAVGCTPYRGCHRRNPDRLHECDIRRLSQEPRRQDAARSGGTRRRGTHHGRPLLRLEPDVRVTTGGQVEQGRRRVVPAQAEVVRRIFDWRIEGRSASWVLKRLNVEGVPTRLAVSGASL